MNDGRKLVDEIQSIDEEDTDNRRKIIDEIQSTDEEDTDNNINLTLRIGLHHHHSPELPDSAPLAVPSTLAKAELPLLSLATGAINGRDSFSSSTLPLNGGYFSYYYDFQRYYEQPSAELTTIKPSSNPENHTSSLDLGNKRSGTSSRNRERQGPDIKKPRRSNMIINSPEDNNNGEREPIIPIHYRWATNRTAKIQPLQTLLLNGIKNISGEVMCRKCCNTHEIEYDLMEKFTELKEYIKKEKDTMHHRAPPEWMSPPPEALPACQHCGNNVGCRPVFPDDNHNEKINWLFLLLGQMLGFCSISQLKYFCKNNRLHMTGAKDRLLYLAYLNLCKQLVPSNDLFEI